MTHITETGMYAGRPICGCNKEECATAGDTFSHLPYQQIDAFMAGADICPDCKEEFDAAMAEDDDRDPEMELAPDEEDDEPQE